MSLVSPASGEHAHASRTAVASPPAVEPGSTPLDLLVLSATGVVGGAERALVDMVAALRVRRPHARIGVLLAAGGPLADELAPHGVRVVPMSWPAPVARLGDAMLGDAGRARWLRMVGILVLAAPAMLGYAWRYRAVLARLQPKLVQTNGFKMHVLGAVMRRRGTPVVWHLHDFISSRPLMSRLLRLLAPRVAAAIANSRSVAADAAKTWGAEPPTTTVYNAVDLERFQPDGPRVDLDARAGLPPAPHGTVRVGLVATLAAWKGHDVLIRAVARLPRTLPVRAYVIGGAIYQTTGSEASLHALQELAARLGVVDRVGFTGFVADTPAVMRALDVVVHASTKPEPFGLVIAEGMATGRAVVVSSAGGAAELIEDGVDAIAYRPGDDVALAAVLEHLVRDAALRERLGVAARATARRRFDRARLGAEIAALHQAVLEGQ